MYIHTYIYTSKGSDSGLPFSLGGLQMMPPAAERRCQSTVNTWIKEQMWSK